MKSGSAPFQVRSRQMIRVPGGFMPRCLSGSSGQENPTKSICQSMV